MVSQGTLWCLGITAATAVGIWIIHEQQTEEREVRHGAVAFLRAIRCLPRTEHRLNMVQQRPQPRALRVQAAAAALRRCLLPTPTTTTPSLLLSTCPAAASHRGHARRGHVQG